MLNTLEHLLFYSLPKNRIGEDVNQFKKLYGLSFNQGFVSGFKDYFKDDYTIVMENLKSKTKITANEIEAYESTNIVKISDNEWVLDDSGAKTLFFKDSLIKGFEKAEEVKFISKDLYPFFRKKFNLKKESQHTLLETSKKQSIDEMIEGASAPAKILKEVLELALKKKASDIHFEPNKDFLDIHLRLRGVLTNVKKINSSYKEGLIREFKKVFGFSTTKKREIQESSGTIETLGITYRGSLIPTKESESIVLRLIHHDFTPTIKELGLEEDALDELIKNICGLKEGVIIISGPTGSGKSTSLYALIDYLNSADKKCISIEDPVERKVEGIIQFEVSNKNTFNQLIKSSLRHDPDIIFIGEIRDEISAEAAFKAADTGHLVLASIHANCSMSTINRLEGLGIKKEAIKETLKVSLAQRLHKIECSCDTGCYVCDFTKVIYRVPDLEIATLLNGNFRKTRGFKYV